MNKIFIVTSLFISLLLSSCEPDQALITPDLDAIQRFKATEILLRSNTWGFNDLIVDVKYEMKAIPLLANVADENGMVQPGQYNSFDIFGNDNRQKFYSYQFTVSRINRDTSDSGIFDKIAFYKILNSTEIKINPDSLGSASYTYRYLDKEQIFKMTSDHITNGVLSDAITKRITDAISSGKPDDIANYVVDKILGNEEIQASIQKLLYDMINGKLDQIAENPEEISQRLASLIVEKLKEVDWESLVYDKLVVLLEQLKVEDPEQAAHDLAVKISEKIETSISQSDIYEVILPVLQKFENETLPKLVPVLSEKIYGVIAGVFTEENIYSKIYPLWINFSEIDSTNINTVADTLGTVITNHFFDADALATSLEPFIALLRSTSTIKIPDLAQDIIDTELKPRVDTINANFPGLELNPDWNRIKQGLTSALTVLKASIGDQTDAEAAASLADSVIAIMDSIITKGVEAAIFKLQDIPAEQASQVIAAWVSNLVTIAEPQIVTFLEVKLNELASLFNAEEVAESLSVKISGKIKEVFSEDNIYNLILPVMQRFSEFNTEAAAQKITDWLFDLGLIKDNITEEQVLDKLTEIIGQMIGNINVDEASQKLVDLILQSDIVQNIDGEVLRHLIEIKIYDFLINLGKEINAIDTIELSLVIK